jgi:hypothetical protein
VKSEGPAGPSGPVEHPYGTWDPEAYALLLERQWLEAVALAWSPARSDLLQRDLAMRNAALSIHQSIEELLGLLLSTKFIARGDNTRFDAFMELVSRMDYVRKMEALEEFGMLPKEVSGGLHLINNVRVAFAHGFSRDHKKFRFLKSSVFGRFREFVGEADRVAKALSKRIDEELKGRPGPGGMLVGPSPD